MQLSYPVTSTPSFSHARDCRLLSPLPSPTPSLKPGQTDSQVDASLDLHSTCVSFGYPLASTCIDLRWLWSSSYLDASIDASFLPFSHPAQVNTSWSQVICCYKNALTNDVCEIYVFLRLATLRKSVRKFWFCKLALTCVDLRVRLARALHMTAVSCHLSSISAKIVACGTKKQSRLKAATSYWLDINSYTHRLFMVGWFSTILQVRTHTKQRTHTHKHTQSSHNKNLTVYSGETKSFGSVGHRHQKHPK